jgi:flagellar basal body-associated protein FliL
MLIFGSDDNDDNLDLDGNKTPATPSNSSLPTRPATKSPFGSNADQVENLVPEKKPGTLSRPVPPSSPFGQNTPVSKPRLPQNPLSEARRIPAASENNEIKAPFSKPAESARAEPVTPPATPVLSSYLPPVKKVETVEPQPQQPTYEEPEEQPERLSENELFIRSMKEQSDVRAAEARLKEVDARAAAPIANTVAPTTVSSIAATAPAPVPINDLAEGKGKKKKQGFFSPPPKKDKQDKTNQAVKSPKENKYAGERKKIFYIRLVAGSIAAIVAIAGVQAIFFGDNGPTDAEIQSAAKVAVNYTGFPTASGEQFALDFAKTYFTFDPADKTRRDSLERFASTELVKQIDIATLSSAEAEAVKKENQSASATAVSQTITYGPYVVANKNLTAENAVFTVKVGLNAGTVVYLDVPVKYDSKNYAMTLAGPPSFTKPIQNKGEAKSSEWTSVFEGGSDDKIQASIQSDLEAYLSAWALSDSTIINRYTLDKATDNARRGLQSSVKFNKIIDLQIEPLDDSRPSTKTSRRVEVNVMWEDTKTNLRYPQQYRMLIGLNPDNKWAIYNIENFAVLSK